MNGIFPDWPVLTLAYMYNVPPPKKGEKNYRMWADAQRDGRPAEYSCHPLQNFRNYIPCSMPQNLADARWLSAVQ